MVEVANGLGGTGGTTGGVAGTDTGSDSPDKVSELNGSDDWLADFSLNIFRMPLPI